MTMRLTGLTKRYGIILPPIIFLLYLMISVTPDLRLSVPEWIGYSAVIMMLLSLVLYFDQSDQTPWSAGFILFVAAALRLLFLWRAPELSDDLYRYLFDGLTLLDGRNPYAMAPAGMSTADPALSGLIRRINHADLPTIYPPFAQFVFAAGALSGSIFGMKLLLVLIDLCGCLLILRLLDHLRLPRGRAILYAWHPLPVIEIAASGHIDAAAVSFTLLTLVFLLAGKPGGDPSLFRPDKGIKGIPASMGSGEYGWAAGIAFSMAVLTKWVPLIFLPGLLLLTTSKNRKYAVSGLLVSLAVMIGLFWPEVQNSFYSLSMYVANWEFSGFLFRCLRSATGSGNIARGVIAAGFAAASAIILFRCIRTERQEPPARDREVFRSFYLTAIVFLFFTPTLHPWYALYLTAFLPFAVGPAGILFSWSVFLAYRIVILYGLTGEWMENDFIPFLIVMAPVAAFAAGRILRRVQDSDRPAKNR